MFVFSIWTQQTFACSKSTIKTKFEICQQLTIKNYNDAIDVVLVPSFLMLNSFHILFLCFSYYFWTGNSLLDGMISQKKPLKIESFLPSSFAITKICVAIRLAGDGTRMGGIWFPLFPSIPLVEVLCTLPCANAYKNG